MADTTATASAKTIQLRRFRLLDIVLPSAVAILAMTLLSVNPHKTQDTRATIRTIEMQATSQPK
jgi:ubiquinone biosynthesis protein Coq4